MSKKTRKKKHSSKKIRYSKKNKRSFKRKKTHKKKRKKTKIRKRNTNIKSGGVFITTHEGNILSDQYLSIKDKDYKYEIRPLQGIQYFKYLIKQGKFQLSINEDEHAKKEYFINIDDNNLVIERRNLLLGRFMSLQ